MKQIIYVVILITWTLPIIGLALGVFYKFLKQKYKKPRWTGSWSYDFTKTRDEETFEYVLSILQNNGSSEKEAREKAKEMLLNGEWEDFLLMNYHREDIANNKNITI